MLLILLPPSPITLPTKESVTDMFSILRNQTQQYELAYNYLLCVTLLANLPCP